MSETEREAILEQAAALSRRRLFCDLLVYASSPSQWVHGIPRLLLQIAGRCEALAFFDGGERRIELRPRGMCYCAANGLLHNKPLRGQPFRGLSFSYYATYIRANYVEHGGLRDSAADVVVYYHTDQPLGKTGQAILAALDAMREEPDPEIAGVLMRALLSLTLRVLRENRRGASPNTSRTWGKILTFLHAHPEQHFTRKQLAGIFRLSPGYISYLAGRHGPMAFSATQREFKLCRAANLLVNTRLTVKEIGHRCGFAHTHYFIRCFKRRFAATPRAYRDGAACRVASP